MGTMNFEVHMKNIFKGNWVAREVDGWQSCTGSYNISSNVETHKMANEHSFI